MRPIIIKSHERPLSQVKYNGEGDLLFTCAKDGNCPIAAFHADDGERLGTYTGHTGAVVSLDVTRGSKWLISAGQDSAVFLWDVKTGQPLYRWDAHQPARAVAFGKIDPHLVMYTTDPFSTTAPSIRFVRIAELPQDTDPKPIMQIDLQRAQRVMRAVFTDADKVAVTVSDDGFARRWDVESGKMLLEEQVHSSIITDLQVSPDGTHALTSSKDKTAKIIDLETLQIVRSYVHTRPVNSAAMSPLDHVALVGGQDAADVTVTADAAGGFDTHFFHKIYEEEFGTVRGHFGPVNSVAIAPDGKSFATGGEDGFVRLQHFDMDYLATKFIAEP